MRASFVEPDQSELSHVQRNFESGETVKMRSIHFLLAELTSRGVTNGK